jgi:hypothetical protein
MKKTNLCFSGNSNDYTRNHNFAANVDRTEYLSQWRHSGSSRRMSLSAILYWTTVLVFRRFLNNRNDYADAKR